MVDGGLKADCKDAALSVREKDARGFWRFCGVLKLPGCVATQCLSMLPPLGSLIAASNVIVLSHAFMALRAAGRNFCRSLEDHFFSFSV